MQGISRFKAGVIYLFVVPLVWLLVSLFFTKSIPMLDAAIFGNPKEHACIVERPDRGGSKNCRPKIVLPDLPFMVDQLCGTPHEMLAQMQPGMTVYAIGRGTKNGVFYNQFRW